MLLTLPLALPAQAAISVEVFLSVDCPISNRYVPELNRIFKIYRAKAVSFTAWFPETSLQPSKLAQWVEQYRAEFPCRLDPGASSAKRTGATLTPQAVVFSSGSRIYRGRIDDRYRGWGVARPQPTQRDLIETLDLLLAGQTPSPRETKVWGCFIETGASL